MTKIKNLDLLKTLLLTIPADDSCMEWPRGRHNRGYGKIWTGTREFVHRVAYRLAIGTVPDGMEVLHKCDNPPCFRPSHLAIGTHDDNMKDAARKGRTHAGERHRDHKVTVEQVKEIRALSGDVTQRELGRMYGLDKSVISRMVTRQTWRSVE